MNGKPMGEIIAMVAIGVLIATGGKLLLWNLSQHKLFGVPLVIGLIVVAVLATSRAYDPNDPAARTKVTTATAYLCAAVIALWCILAPTAFAFGACIAMAEAALVFDVISSAVRGRFRGA
jgi:hypothetical protein